jgi:hypothetical protein
MTSYLGDGVYARVDKEAGQIILTANDPKMPTDTIYLEQAVLESLFTLAINNGLLRIKDYLH